MSLLILSLIATVSYPKNSVSVVTSWHKVEIFENFFEQNHTNKRQVHIIGDELLDLGRG
jgi:hypothetical protein